MIEIRKHHWNISRQSEKNLAETPAVSSFVLSMDVTSFVLGSFIFSVVSGSVVYLLGVEPGRVVERWLVALSNGEPLPQRPKIGCRFWLYGIHRECLAVEKRINDMHTGYDSVQAKLARVEFMQNFVLGSLMEGVMVVDDKFRITLVNTEFLSLFQLAQSPLNRTVKEVMADTRLHALVQAAFTSGQAQAGRITHQFNNPEGGRPPAFEVSAVPVRTSATQIGSVVVLFLPPPDRSRIVQVLKRHSEKLQRLAEAWTPNNSVLLRTSVAELSDAVPLGEINRKIEPISQN